jgi:hypothetical protein
MTRKGSQEHVIVDVHYHYWRLPADDQAARRIAAGLLEDIARNGIKESVENVLPALRDLMDDTDCDKLVNRMDADGIDVSVLLVMDNADIPGFSDERVLRLNESCAKAAARHPGRLIAFAGVDPRRPDAPALFRNCLTEFKMSGLKWHPDNGFYPNGKEAYAVLKVASEFKVPLLTHCGLLSRSHARYTHPLHLDDVAVDFPDIPIIGAHMGHLWWRDWLAVAQYKANLFGDLSMWQLLAVSKPALFRRYLREVIDVLGPDQVLFATDGPVYEPVVSNKTWLGIMKRLTDREHNIVFSQAEVDAMLGGNAARILRLGVINR